MSFEEQMFERLERVYKLIQQYEKVNTNNMKIYHSIRENIIYYLTEIETFGKEYRKENLTSIQSVDDIMRLIGKNTKLIKSITNLINRS